MYLGLDLGTSGVKAMLIDATQRVVGSASAPLSVSRPHPGWSEQDPADWIAATEGAIDALARDHATALSAVTGIGLSGQMHGATVLDASDAVLRPAILWNDTRSHAEAAALDAQPAFRAISGNIVFPGFTAPKLAWMARHEADLFARAAKVLLPKDYLRLWLTGEHVSEMSDASGTSWLDVGQRRWSRELLAATGLEERHMPRLVEGSEPSGRLRDALKARWNIAGSVSVAGGAGDNAASACGIGAVAEGQAFVSLGTSGVLFAANDGFRPNAESAVHAFCHALPGAWHQMGVMLSATDCLNWLAGVAGETPEALTAALGDQLSAPGRTVFLPYLSGERTPHNEPESYGAFVGLSHGSDRTVLAKAVLEGVAYGLRDNLAALEAAGTKVTRVTAVGGGSRSTLWLETIATVLGVPVDLPAEGDFGAALGAARLGLIAAEGADPLAVCTAPRTARTIEPDHALAPAFDEGWQRFRALYPAIKGAFQ
jgi:xylulokinase